ncbi:hypothetical protein FO519_001117 [Halicephalobus sp. NKZ332]|nr:hypothetical protein FO519_001117 [Halicephalobus sp. NKZ332]
MPGIEDNSGQSFSTTVGLLYVFNLIVGTGALALPKAFQTAGWLLGTILLLISGFVSYICATFILEAMSVTNAALKSNGQAQNGVHSIEDEENTDEAENSSEEQFVHQTRSFDITRRVELSEMSLMLLGRVGVIGTYIVLTLYLFGDLAIYSTTVPKSLMNVLCESPNATKITSDLPCYIDSFNNISRMTVYRICVVTFAIFCLPLVLVGMARTKYIQLATTVSRWTAFSLMIVLASMQLIQNGPQASPSAVEVNGFGSLFGVAIYAFMCHHSIPGLITPIKDKSYFSYKLIYVYGVIFAFYCTLSVTGSFAFHTVQDVYTLNFLHDDKTSFVYSIIDYFLALFPVFTLTSSYIIVAITLSNNLRVLVSMFKSSSQSVSVENEALLNSGSDTEDAVELRPSSTQPNNYSAFADQFTHYFIPVIAILLPTVLSFFNDNVLFLASITGSYPGVGVQFVIPSLLVLGARRFARSKLHQKVPSTLRSPFSHDFWPILTLIWAAFTVVNVTIHLFHFG